MVSRWHAIVDGIVAEPIFDKWASLSVGTFPSTERRSFSKGMFSISCVVECVTFLKETATTSKGDHT
jgi:hypothetical protein